MARSISCIKREVSIGVLISFNALLAYFIEPIERMINLQPQLQSAIVAADRLGEILDLEKEKAVNEDKKINPSTLLGEIKLKNIDFRYGTRQLVLKDINMDIKPGEKVALVGKAVQVRLLLQSFNEFLWCRKGEIVINNYNIKDINKEAL